MKKKLQPAKPIFRAVGQGHPARLTMKNDPAPKKAKALPHGPVKVSPLSTTEIFKCFKIFRLPIAGSATVPFRVVSLYGPTQEAYSFTQLVTSLTTILNATTDDQNTAIRALIATWDNETLDSNITFVDSDAGTNGRLYNADALREQIRQALADIIGFAVPSGGFMAEVSRATPYRGPRLIR